MRAFSRPRSDGTDLSVRYCLRNPLGCSNLRSLHHREEPQMTRLTILAATHRDAVLHETWAAFLADVPMTWLEGR